VGEARAAGEARGEVLCAEGLEVVAADVEVRECGVAGDEGREGDGAARAALVAREAEGVERGAEDEGRGEGGDAAVVEGVEAEVEVLEVVEGGERGREVLHAADADVVAAQVEVGEVRGGAQGAGEDGCALGARVAVAVQAEAAQVAAREDLGQAVELGGREEVQARDAGAGGDGAERVEHGGPLGGPRARVLEPEVRVHGDGGGQARARGVDEELQRPGRAAQDEGVRLRPVPAPDVRGDGGEEVQEGAGREGFGGSSACGIHDVVGCCG
jgi:hypothetical protein